MIIQDATLFDGTPTKRIIADEGMTCIRTADGIDFGSDVLLGYRYRDAEGNVLPEGVLEVPADFHEEESTMEEDGYAEFEEV